MNKECYLTLTVRVSGDDEPSHDFARESIALVRSAIKAAGTPERGLQIVFIAEHTDFDA